MSGGRSRRAVSSNGRKRSAALQEMKRRREGASGEGPSMAEQYTVSALPSFFFQFEFCLTEMPPSAATRAPWGTFMMSWMRMSTAI